MFELRLPPGANVTLVVRDGASFVPDQRTVLRRGAQLLVVATSAVRRDVLRRLRAVSRGGRLAVWGQSAEAPRGTRATPQVPGYGTAGRRVAEMIRGVRGRLPGASPGSSGRRRGGTLR